MSWILGNLGRNVKERKNWLLRHHIYIWNTLNGVNLGVGGSPLPASPIPTPLIKNLSVASVLPSQSDFWRTVLLCRVQPGLYLKININKSYPGEDLSKIWFWWGLGNFQFNWPKSLPHFTSISFFLGWQLPCAHSASGSNPPPPPRPAPPMSNAQFIIKRAFCDYIGSESVAHLCFSDKIRNGGF